jgi:hypothetical protein
LENFWTGLGSALRGDKSLSCATYLWMFPIYGMGGMLLEQVHEIIRGQLWIYRGFIWSFLIFMIELTAGWLLLLTIGKCPWDYDREAEIVAVTVKGLIRLDYLPVWFCLGLLFERMHDFIKILV